MAASMNLQRVDLSGATLRRDCNSTCDVSKTSEGDLSFPMLHLPDQVALQHEIRYLKKVAAIAMCARSSAG